MTETDPLRRLFDEAQQLPEEERETYVRAHAPDTETANQVLALLGVEDQAAGFLDEPATETFGALFHAAPQRLDEFEIVREIGRGGMGVVYEARDTILGRRVALKVLAGHLIGSEQALDRFKDEARSTAQLNHPAIVPVYKFGRCGEGYYIASEFVEGPTLSELIEEERRKRPVEATREWHARCTTIATAIADALEVSHRAGIIHRDVKPSNILIDPVRGARLTDFGIAKQYSDEPRDQTALIGSCHYMSPEQATLAGQRIDQRSDVFSLGVVMYEMLALRKPFDGAGPAQVLRAVIEQVPPRVRSIDRRIPRDLDTICHKAIEKRPVDRYQTAAHVAADLRCHAAGDPILAVRPGIGRRSVRWLWQTRMSTAIASVVILAIVVAAFGWITWTRSNAAVAWVSIDLGGESCRVWLQDHAAETLRPEPKRQVPEQLKLSPGHYRLTIERESDDAICEFNLVLSEVGRRHVTNVRVVDRFDDGEHRIRGDELLGVFYPPDSDHFSGMFPVEGGEFNLQWKPYDSGLLRGPFGLPHFQIDTTEVSNGDYKAFVEATLHRAPVWWTEIDDFETIADLPVIWVSLADAEAFARWNGKRLPTLWEWQAAARGPNGHRYPGGDTPPTGPAQPASRVRVLKPSDAQIYLAGTTPTHIPAPWDVPDRLLHTYSNVRELTGTIIFQDRQIYLLGIDWRDSIAEHDLSRVFTVRLDQPHVSVGIRCARTISESTQEEQP